MRHTPLALALSLTFISNAHADTPPDAVEPVILVSATRIPTPDVAATYASEIHTRAMIDASGATSLVDYLAQHTSLNVTPSFGNLFTPQIDMRGYGSANGFENIVVSLDGQRLNNIDLQPQLLGAIPLAAVDRIEITRGSGSVLYGDGATAGSIQIYTRAYQGVSAEAQAGNDGYLSGTLTAGLSRDNFSLAASSDNQRSDGSSDRDVSGERASSSINTQRGQVRIRPFTPLWLSLDGSRSRIDTRYVGPLTLAQFDSDPAQNGGNSYTHQTLDSDQWRVGAVYTLSDKLQLSASHNQEDKTSDYISYSSKADYDYTTDEVALRYDGEPFKLTGGVQRFDGTRIGASNRTSKNNLGYYLQAEYRLDALTLSVGARRERVAYDYAPTAASGLHSSQNLNAWDIGSNYRFDSRTSVFANYNNAFLAPDIDRFFNFNGSFNAFIAPEKTRTLTVGVNRSMGDHRIKLSVFHARLRDEIYFDPVTFINTNIDRSHKYGLELQDNWRIRNDLDLIAQYTYTRAIVDQQNSASSAADGKDLPGVPRHGVTLGVNYRYSDRSTFNLSHVWRSTAYAANDFSNSFAQKQAAYQSTNIAYHYRYQRYTFSAAVDNVFAHANGLWTQDDAIYPVNFSRQFRVGFKADFD